MLNSVCLYLNQWSAIKSTVYAWISGWGLWKLKSSDLHLSQLLEDHEASVGVFSYAWWLAATAAATGIEPAAVVSQPGTVGTVRVFEAHHITVLHWGTVSSVLGVDLESGVRIEQPVFSGHWAGCSITRKRSNYSLQQYSINNFSSKNLTCM